MKRILLCLAFSVALSAFAVANASGHVDTGKANSGKPAVFEYESKSAIAGSVEDYFTNTQNMKYVYEGSGNEYAAFTVMTDYATGSRLQQRVDNGGTVTVKVIRIGEGKCEEVFSKGEAYARINYLNENNKSDVLLMEPLKKGTTWTLENKAVRTIASVTATVHTPIGSFQTIEVITKEKNSIATDYYAKGIGLVKSVYEAKGCMITSTLKSIEKNVPLTQSVRFFYPDINAANPVFVDIPVSFETNEEPEAALAEAYKAAGSAKVFSDNTSILAIDVKGETAHIDLNSAFITQMNAGAAYESMILQCVANTFGLYYHVPNIELTIKGHPYESGHFAFKRGQVLKACYEQ